MKIIEGTWAVTQDEPSAVSTFPANEALIQGLNKTQCVLVVLQRNNNKCQKNKNSSSALSYCEAVFSALLKLIKLKMDAKCL